MDRHAFAAVVLHPHFAPFLLIGVFEAGLGIGFVEIGTGAERSRSNAIGGIGAQRCGGRHLLRRRRQLHHAARLFERLEAFVVGIPAGGVANDYLIEGYPVGAGDVGAIGRADFKGDGHALGAQHIAAHHRAFHHIDDIDAHVAMLGDDHPRVPFADKGQEPGVEFEPFFMDRHPFPAVVLHAHFAPLFLIHVAETRARKGIGAARRGVGLFGHRGRGGRGRGF